MRSKLAIALTTASLMAGCTNTPDLYHASRPFAELYGARQAKWLDNNQLAILEHSRGNSDFLEIEYKGFKNLDAKNQKLYLVMRFCTHQQANAEDGSQMYRLMSELKTSKKALLSYMLAQDPKSIERYAAYLQGSSKQFYSNATFFCKE